MFQDLGDFEPTRQTLHAYSRVIGSIPRRYADFHPMWWHISLRVLPTGLVTSPVGLPDGHSTTLQLDLTTHMVVLDSSAGLHREWSMQAGLSAADLAASIHEALVDLGIAEGEFAEEVETASLTAYDPEAVGRYLATLTDVDRIFKAHRDDLEGDCGPVQLWPHGFDLAFEWFGTKTQEYEEDGEVKSSPSQLNLGFYPGNPEAEPYFYSNPFPFDEELTGHALPDGAVWHTEGWSGSYLRYAELVGDPDGEARLREFATRVYELARPTLLE